MSVVPHLAFGYHDSAGAIWSGWRCWQYPVRCRGPRRLHLGRADGVLFAVVAEHVRHALVGVDYRDVAFDHFVVAEADTGVPFGDRGTRRTAYRARASAESFAALRRLDKSQVKAMLFCTKVRGKCRTP